MGGQLALKQVIARLKLPFLESKSWAESNEGVDTRIHREVDAVVGEVPEVDHDTVLSLLGDWRRISDQKYLVEKCHLSTVFLMAYMDFLVSEGLLRIFVKRDGRIDGAAITEKGQAYIRQAKAADAAQESSSGARGAHRAIL